MDEEPIKSVRKRDKNQPRRKKVYVPAPGTANYAFLITLFQVRFSNDISASIFSGL